MDGNNLLILEEDDVKVITDLMMVGDGKNVTGELSELNLSSISEAMNQMMGSSATSLSSMLGKKVDISPPDAKLVDMNGSIQVDNIPEFLNGRFVKVAFRMEIEGLIDSQLMQLYPFDFARNLFSMFVESVGISTDTQETPPPPTQMQTPSPQPMMVTPQEQVVQTPPPQPMMEVPPQPMMMQQQMPQQMYMQPQGMPMMPQQMYMPPMQDVNVAPAQFTSFSGMANPITQKENIDLIMDVPLEVSVELGRTNKSIKEILDFKPGTIIELNKLAGEPIDVMVNGKYVAKGEVVVIEECFGIRVTEIIN